MSDPSDLRRRLKLHPNSAQPPRFQFTLGRVLTALTFFGAALACTTRINDSVLGFLVLGFAFGGIVGVLMQGPAGALLGASVGLTLATVAVIFSLTVTFLIAIF